MQFYRKHIFVRNSVKKCEFIICQDLVSGLGREPFPAWQYGKFPVVANLSNIHRLHKVFLFLFPVIYFPSLCRKKFFNKIEKHGRR